MVQRIPLPRSCGTHGSVAEIAASHQVAAIVSEVFQEAIYAAGKAIGPCHTKGAHIVPVVFICRLAPYCLQGTLIFCDCAIGIGNTDDVWANVIKELYPLVELPEVITIVAYA